MKFHEFDSYREYVEAQTKLTRQKVRRGRANLSTSRNVAKAIASDFLKNDSTKSGEGGIAVCHGVRHGQELELFSSQLPHLTWIGTEITAELCDGVSILHHDFHEQLGFKADLIYSNSLDHSYDPEKAVKQWLKELMPGGRIYIEWTRYDERLGGFRNVGDCFAATIEEYRLMLVRIGTLADDIKVRDEPERRPRPLNRRIFVVTHAAESF